MRLRTTGNLTFKFSSVHSPYEQNGRACGQRRSCLRRFMQVLLGARSDGTGPAPCEQDRVESDNSVSDIATRTISVGNRPINLTQVLKLGGCVQSGGEAKMLITSGRVRVNGEVELRKCRQMKAGDIVVIEDGPAIVLQAGTSPASGTPDG